MNFHSSSSCVTCVQYLKSVHNTSTGCFYSLRHFGHWNISLICLTVLFKLAVTVFFSLYFQTFWPWWLNFSSHFKIISVYDQKKNRIPVYTLKYVLKLHLLTLSVYQINGHLMTCWEVCTQIQLCQHSWCEVDYQN